MSKLRGSFLLMFTGALEIYNDHVEVKRAFGVTSESIPYSAILNVYINTETSGLTIETDSGQKIGMRFWNSKSAIKARDVVASMMR